MNFEYILNLEERKIRVVEPSKINIDSIKPEVATIHTQQNWEIKNCIKNSLCIKNKFENMI